jgi:cation diffusion facilitator CzcD-associated flavoprotein CzcO
MAHYDAIVIGAGQPGPGVAGALADDGKRVAIIEMDRAGGTPVSTMAASRPRRFEPAHRLRIRPGGRGRTG